MKVIILICILALLEQFRTCFKRTRYDKRIDDGFSVFQCMVGVLSIIQNLDKQVRRGVHEHHVEYESDSWVSVFNLCIRLHSLFSSLAKGIDVATLKQTKVLHATLKRYYYFFCFYQQSVSKGGIAC